MNSSTSKSHMADRLWHMDATRKPNAISRRLYAMSLLAIELVNPTLLNQFLQGSGVAKIIRPVQHLLRHGAAFGKFFQNSLDPAICHRWHALEECRINLDSSFGDLRVRLSQPLDKNFLRKRTVFLYEVNRLDVGFEEAVNDSRAFLDKGSAADHAGGRINEIRL